MPSTPLRRLCHWGPLAVIAIIKLITWAMVHFLGMWWPPQESLSGALHGGLFLLLAASTLYYFLQALLEGPGFVPLGWKPENPEDSEFLQYCYECNGFKAPRAHHCRKCGHCVMKMDHHCPWINCCVGYRNHRYFTIFLFTAVMGCLQATIVLFTCLYVSLQRSRYVRRGQTAPVRLTLGTLLPTLLAAGLALGVVLAVGALLYMQIRGILRNRTSIEDWILEKAASRRAACGLATLPHPYDAGWRRNLQALTATGDGVHWPLREGSGTYDLTIEQLAQKEEKRLRSRVYTAVTSYSGGLVPLCRPRAALSVPLEMSRLTVGEGDTIRATRQKRHWLYGEKVTEDGTKGPRGWFPKYAVVPLDEMEKSKPD